jgi:hypothetical protein
MLRNIRMLVGSEPIEKWDPDPKKIIPDPQH